MARVRAWHSARRATTTKTRAWCSVVQRRGPTRGPPSAIGAGVRRVRKSAPHRTVGKNDRRSVGCGAFGNWRAFFFSVSVSADVRFVPRPNRRAGTGVVRFGGDSLRRVTPALARRKISRGVARPRRALPGAQDARLARPPSAALASPPAHGSHRPSAPPSAERPATSPSYAPPRKAKKMLALTISASAARVCVASSMHHPETRRAHLRW